MLTVATLGRGEVARQLARDGLWLRTGRFTSRLQSTIPAVADGLTLLYPDAGVLSPDSFADFHLKLQRPLLRRWYRPQCEILLDGQQLFQPMPLPQALPMLEWGLNWCVSSRANRFLIVHAAVLEKDGRALIMPAPPGSGKSTLTAALAGRGGWRLLSDELTLLNVDTGLVMPNPRPISLKNTSIDVIRRYLPEAVLSPAVTDTVKGTVALMRAPGDSVRRSDEPALPAWVIFPKFAAGAATSLEPLAPAAVFMDVAANSFNYSMLAQQGFHTLARLSDQVSGYRFTYSELDEALALMSRLTPRH